MGTSNTTSYVPNVAQQNTTKQKFSVKNSNNKNEMSQYLLLPTQQINIVLRTTNPVGVHDNKKRSSVNTTDILDGTRTLRQAQGDMTNNFGNKTNFKVPDVSTKNRTVDSAKGDDF